MEAVQYAFASIATNVPNALQCVSGRRIASELAEEAMLQMLASRLCHREPEVQCRPADDAAAEGRLATLQRMAADAAACTRERIISDYHRVKMYTRRREEDFDAQAGAAAAQDN